MREAMTATAPSGARATLPSRAASRGAAWRLSRDPYGVPRRGSDVLNVLSHEVSAEQLHRRVIGLLVSLSTLEAVNLVCV